MPWWQTYLQDSNLLQEQCHPTGTYLYSEVAKLTCSDVVCHAPRLCLLLPSLLGCIRCCSQACCCVLERMFDLSMPLQAQATHKQSTTSGTSVPITPQPKGPSAELWAALPTDMQSRLGPAACQLPPPKADLADEQLQIQQTAASSTPSQVFDLLPLRLQRRLTPAATYAAQFTEPQQHAGQSFGLDGHSPQGFIATSSLEAIKPKRIDNWAHRSAEQRLQEAAELQHMQQQRPRISGVGELPQTEAQVVARQLEQQPHRKTSNRYHGSQGGAKGYARR